MRYMAVLFFLLLSTPIFATPKITVDGSAVKITTPRYEAKLVKGSVAYFRDKTTKETYLAETGSPAPFVRYSQNGAPYTLHPDKSAKYTAKKIAKDTVRIYGKFGSKNRAVSLYFDAKALDNELVVTGSARALGASKGISAIGISTGATDEAARLIVPTMGGMAFDSKGMRSLQSLEWPITWEAPIVLVQGNKGGLLVGAFEPFKRYKNLQLIPTAKSWSIALETENQAPFDKLERVSSVAWHFKPYSGDWRTGAKMYKDWHAKQFKPDAGEDPAWLKDIRAEFHCGIDLSVPDVLVKAGVDPKQTIIYIPDWRTYGYDINYPDYTPRPELAAFVEKAHGMGFKVMLHTNYFGVDPVSPFYPVFKPFQQKNKYSGQLLFWEWTMSEPNTKIAYINAASADWRKFFVGKMVELVKKTGVDALHLDQTLCIVNDCNGLIEGKTNAEGALLLHKELKKALPLVVISGEGLNEVTSVHEGLAQRHVQGIDHVKGTHDRRLLDQCHPISAYLFGTRTKSYSYLGTPGPGSEQLFLAWCDAWRNWGTVMGSGWSGNSVFEQPNGAATYELEVIKAMQQNRLDPDMDGKWPNNISMSYIGKDGSLFGFVSGNDGWSLSRLDPDYTPAGDIIRVISGVQSTRRPGTIPNYINYDSEKISGLDPERYYVCLPNSRDMTAFHLEISEPDCRITDWMSDNSIAMARLNADRTILSANELISTGKPFWQKPDGSKTDLTGSISESTGAICTPRGNGLFMHPPWKDGKKTEKGDFGLTGIGFKVKIPADSSAEFSADCVIEWGAVGKTDGAVFTITARAGGLVRSSEASAGTESTARLRLDLSEFAGKEAEVTITIGPGPKNDVSFDWGLLSNIKIVSAQKLNFDCKVFWPKYLDYMVAPNYANLSNAEDGVKLQVKSGQAVMAVNYSPETVSNTASLLELAAKDYAISSGSNQISFAKEMPLTKETETVEGQVKRSMFTHPPSEGVRIVNYYISLPQGSSARLTGYAGLRANSKSGGVVFRIWKNGEELWSKNVVPADGWIPFDVSLGTQTNEPIMLSLVTDSAGSHYFDWSTWVDPVIVINR